MANSSLQQTIADINKEIRLDANGVGYVTIRGAARLSGVAEQSLQESIASVKLRDRQ